MCLPSRQDRLPCWLASEPHGREGGKDTSHHTPCSQRRACDKKKPKRAAQAYPQGPIRAWQLGQLLVLVLVADGFDNASKFDRSSVEWMLPRPHVPSLSPADVGLGWPPSLLPPDEARSQARKKDNRRSELSLIICPVMVGAAGRFSRPPPASPPSHLHLPKPKSRRGVGTWPRGNGPPPT